MAIAKMICLIGASVSIGIATQSVFAGLAVGMIGLWANVWMADWAKFIRSR